AISLVVLVVVGDEVVEGEAIVTRDEVHARLGLALLVTVNLGAAEQPICEPWHGAFVATEEAPHIVAKTSVPLPPTVAHEAANLVKTAGVPGLGDDLRAG